MLQSNDNPLAMSAPAPPADHRWSLWPVAAGLLILLVSLLLIAVATTRFPNPGGPLFFPLFTAVATLALGLAQIAFVWGFTLRSWPPGFAQLDFTPSRRHWLVTVGLVLVVAVCSVGFSHLYGQAVTALDWEALRPAPLSPKFILPGPWAIFSLFVLAVWTPLAEELFFRGFILRRLASRCPAWAALTLSSAVFSAVHFSLSHFIPIFFIGMLLGALYLHTRSLWPSIAVHALQNGLVVILVIAMAQISDNG